MSLANLNMMATLKIGFRFMYIVYRWINGRYIIRDILVELFFNTTILFVARRIYLHVLRVYHGSRVRGFIPSVLDWEEGLIVSYPRYIITDRMFNRPDSYRLWVSVIRVVCPVNVVHRLGTFEYEFMFRRRRGWKKNWCASDIILCIRMYCCWSF